MLLICRTVAFLNQGNCSNGRKDSLPAKKIKKPSSDMCVTSGFNVLLPLDRCRGLAGYVVDYPVYAADFVYYAIGY